jgi:peptidoglycan/xylan/chitin deacetylase (PgdA/CDA1 family)
MTMGYKHNSMGLSIVLAFTILLGLFVYWPKTPLAVDPTRMVLPQTGQMLEPITLRYTFDRSGLPPLNHPDVTLKIQVGEAEQLAASADGQAVAVQYDRSTGVAVVTTAGAELVITFMPTAPSEGVGTYELATLKDDRAWAWSHSFDDNKGFEKRAIPAFDQYGWRATVYAIGKDLNDSRREDWIMDRPDLIDLLRKGWGLGNHSWSHQSVSAVGGQSAARSDVLRLANYLRAAADEAGRPDYILTAFAAPNFDSAYHPVLLSLRGSGESGLLFNESGSNGFMRVDQGQHISDGRFTVFDPDEPIGRDWRIDRMGSGDDYDRTFRADVEAMLAALGPDQHYWLNTFTHDVDDRPAQQSIFAFLPWLYNTYGLGGDNSVWVAPAEEIYAYLLVRDGVKITYSVNAQTAEPLPTRTPVEPTPTPIPTVQPVLPRLYLPMIWISPQS